MIKNKKNKFIINSILNDKINKKIKKTKNYWMIKLLYSAQQVSSSSQGVHLL